MIRKGRWGEGRRRRAGEERGSAGEGKGRRGGEREGGEGEVRGRCGEEREGRRGKGVSLQKWCETRRLPALSPD